MPANRAGQLAGINPRTAQDYVKKYREDQEQRVPVPGGDRSHSRGGNRKLFDEHTIFLIKFWDEKPSATLEEARQVLAIEFEGLDITLSGLRKHVIKHCRLTLKKLEKLPARRVSDDILDLRRKMVLEWKTDENLDYMSTCVFLDEAGFNMHLRRGFGWSKKGTPAKTVIPTQKGVNITIMGAICELGVVCLSLRKPTACVSIKEGKKVKGVVGTRTGDFLAYINAVMDALETRGLTKRYLVMDNAPIHKNPAIRELIEARGHQVLYLPPWSPFLNPIEEFWSKVKAGVRRCSLTEGDSLTPRILESTRLVTPSDCVGWIRHSMSFFDRCINGEKNL
jgi:transposase